MLEGRVVGVVDEDFEDEGHVQVDADGWERDAWRDADDGRGHQRRLRVTCLEYREGKDDGGYEENQEDDEADEAGAAVVPVAAVVVHVRRGRAEPGGGVAGFGHFIFIF